MRPERRKRNKMFLPLVLPSVCLSSSVLHHQPVHPRSHLFYPPSLIVYLIPFFFPPALLSSSPSFYLVTLSSFILVLPFPLPHSFFFFILFPLSLSPSFCFSLPPPCLLYPSSTLFLQCLSSSTHPYFSFSFFCLRPPSRPSSSLLFSSSSPLFNFLSLTLATFLLCFSLPPYLPPLTLPPPLPSWNLFSFFSPSSLHLIFPSHLLHHLLPSIFL